MCNCLEDFPNNEIDICKIYGCEVVLGASDDKISPDKQTNNTCSPKCYHGGIQPDDR